MSQESNLDKARSNRLGMAGYVPVLAAMPGTVAAIASKLGRSRQGVLVLVREMRQLGFVGRVGDDRSVLRAVQPVWAFGDWPRERLASVPRAQVIAFASLLLGLRRQPSSVTDLAASTGLHPAVVRKVITALRDHQLARVVAWRRRHGAPIALHGLGAGPDAEQPAAMTKQQINRRYNERQRSARERRERLAHIPRSVFDLGAVAL